MVSTPIYLVKEEYEKNLISSLIYSLSELENINSISILIENKPFLVLPNSKEVLPNILDKSFGINKEYNIENILNTVNITSYYVKKNTDNTLYYVPITKASNTPKEKIEIIINELKTVPINKSNFISYLNASYELNNYEILENSIAISFNNKILANLKDENIIEIAKYCLSLSIRDTYNIDNVNIIVN